MLLEMFYGSAALIQHENRQGKLSKYKIWSISETILLQMFPTILNIGYKYIYMQYIYKMWRMNGVGRAA